MLLHQMGKQIHQQIPPAWYKHHDMKMLSALLTFFERNPPVTAKFLNFVKVISLTANVTSPKY